jgi:hypothetical protein
MRRIEGFNPSGEVNSYQVIVASVLEKDGRFLCIEELVHSKLKLKQPAGQLEVGEPLGTVLYARHLRVPLRTCRRFDPPEPEHRIQLTRV